MRMTQKTTRLLRDSLSFHNWIRSDVVNDCHPRSTAWARNRTTADAPSFFGFKVLELYDAANFLLWLSRERQRVDDQTVLDRRTQQ
jgi:hypothetical protein